jgi:hypothetical protein
LSSRSATSSSALAFLRCAASRSPPSSCNRRKGRQVSGCRKTSSGGLRIQILLCAPHAVACQPPKPCISTPTPTDPPTHLLLRIQSLLLRRQLLQLLFKRLEPLLRLPQLIQHAALLVAGRRLLALQLQGAGQGRQAGQAGGQGSALRMEIRLRRRGTAAANPSLCKAKGLTIQQRCPWCSCICGTPPPPDRPCPPLP